MSSRHIVFFSHEATRTGAPILLLHLLGWIKRNTDWTFEVVCQDDGPLVARFRELCPTVVYYGRRYRWLRRLRYRPLAAVALPMRRRWLKARIRRSQPAALYYNTMAVQDLFPILAPLGLPTLIHVHELERVIANYGPGAMARLDAARPRYIAASRAVADNLMARHAIPPDRLQVIHEFISPPELPSEDPAQGRAQLCDRLAIPRESVIVGGMGTIDLRKGTDLFVEAAGHVRRLEPDRPIHFVWMGGPFDPNYATEIEALTARLGLGSTLHFLGQVAQPFAVMRHFNIFALTSREDPYPLVMLEAGALGLPVIGFADSGGAPEYIEDDAGIVVPFEDTRAMAGAIVDLARDPDRAKALGTNGARKVLSRHTTELTSPRIFHEIIQMVARA